MLGQHSGKNQFQNFRPTIRLRRYEAKEWLETNALRWAFDSVYRELFPNFDVTLRPQTEL